MNLHNPDNHGQNGFRLLPLISHGLLAFSSKSMGWDTWSYDRNFLLVSPHDPAENWSFIKVLLIPFQSIRWCRMTTESAISLALCFQWQAGKKEEREEGKEKGRRVIRKGRWRRKGGKEGGEWKEREVRKEWEILESLSLQRLLKDAWHMKGHQHNHY